MKMSTTLRVAGSTAAVVALACVGVIAASVHRLDRTYAVALEPFDAAAHRFAPAEAERRARSLMCVGCHERAGRVIFDDPAIASLVAPNLSRVAKDYDDRELERLLRHGIKKDGTAVVAMPSATYAHLADEDVAAVVAWVRSLPPVADAMPNRTTWGPLGRVALALGQVPIDADHIAPIAHPADRPRDLGRYLVETTCLHCHDLDRTRDNGFGMVTPPLAAVTKGYSFAAFDRLISTGKGTGDRDLGLMSAVASQEFVHFDAVERRAIHDYLTAPGS
jgi:cytochrome c553